MSSPTAEKLHVRGVASLSDTELIALLLEDDLELAERVLAQGGSLAEMGVMPLSRLRTVGGMGLRMAQKITTCAEIGRRMRLTEADSVQTISQTSDVDRLLRPRLERLSHEEFWCLYLTAANRVIESACLSRGGVQGTVVDTRMVIKRALELLSARIILIHNHPSGTCTPSEQDLQLTARVHEAAALFDITLLDHVIIAPRAESISFRKQGLL